MRPPMRFPGAAKKQKTYVFPGSKRNKTQKKHKTHVHVRPNFRPTYNKRGKKHVEESEDAESRCANSKTIHLRNVWNVLCLGSVHATVAQKKMPMPGVGITRCIPPAPFACGDWTDKTGGLGVMISQKCGITVSFMRSSKIVVNMGLLFLWRHANEKTILGFLRVLSCNVVAWIGNCQAVALHHPPSLLPFDSYKNHRTIQIKHNKTY